MVLGAIVLPTGSFRGSLPLVLSDVECDGNESSILSCTSNTSHIQCDSGIGAAIVCQGREYRIVYAVELCKSQPRKHICLLIIIIPHKIKAIGSNYNINSCVMSTSDVISSDEEMYLQLCNYLALMLCDTFFVCMDLDTTIQ